MSKRPIEDVSVARESTSPPTKKADTSDKPPSMAMMTISGPPASASTAGSSVQGDTLARQRIRFTLDSDPAFETLLTNRGEYGYWRESSRKVLKTVSVEIKVTELRRCMSAVLSTVLTALHQNAGSMRTSEIATEVNLMVPIIVDVCISALYAKLRNIHRSFGVHPTRYTTAPAYSKDIELPLPFALLIQEFGTFETSCLPENVIYVPTYPEGVQNDGRATAQYQVTSYLSYLPTLRELKMPMKSIDVHLKQGSPWWTYQLEVYGRTVDLACTLPPSNYTDFSAILRTLLIAKSDEEQFSVPEIVKHPDKVSHFGYRMKALRDGVNVRSFTALSHCPANFWAFPQG